MSKAAASRGARAEDERGGPDHTVILAVALAVPAVKLAYTVGGHEAAWEVLIVMEPTNWPDILIGMVLASPALAAVLAVVSSRMVFAHFAARSVATGAVTTATGPAAVARGVALAAVNPLAVGILMAVFFGPWWGTATGLVAFALRQGVVAEYRLGRRTPDGALRRTPPGAPRTWRHRVTATQQWAALFLAVLALPFTAFASALDGTSWAPVVDCTVDTEDGSHPDRLIELTRRGNGVVGWSPAHHEAVNGTACTSAGTRVIRDPWYG
ncbi:hypothetical protein I3F58_09390 [Streptomyces sp. MUM 203J]|uniref:hypothetical protein n=1 Tax=Streptomyces sp. MUM 203J TaxID=2791990 RepID=UPI001F035793|nr:hypothetical protein [Streptomyces sp. MUM 203J]MCH0539772.1 hypothetical protein [Streptomyces sp. MUM 203J]